MEPVKQLDGIQEVELTDRQRQKLTTVIRHELSQAIGAHEKRLETLAKYRQAYKALPEQEEKSFPWPGAANVVVPIVSMAVDAIVARLMKATLATQEFVEVKINNNANEWQEKDVRDWINHFMVTGGVRDRLRTIFHDMAMAGDAFLKPMWVDKKRKAHSYDASGNVVSAEITDYTGPIWDIAAPDDIITPNGFDEWDRLPWFAQILRFTWFELVRDREKLGFREINKLRGTTQERQDRKFDQVQKSDTAPSGGVAHLHEVYEIWGLFEIPSPGPEDESDDYEPVLEELIIHYSLKSDHILRVVYNPFFGYARHMKKIPYLHQPHELYGMSCAEQAYSFQVEASTAHNQAIDATTAAIAGIVVVSPDTNLGTKEEIYPGKMIKDPNPDKIRVIHLSSPAQANGMIAIEDKAIHYAERRTGVSSYHLGQESTIVGSQATATGTTALLAEGNTRFWVSIDDMRHALEECLYLTISLVQQFAPDGVDIGPDRHIKFPQGDVRTSLGLTIKLSSETINRDIQLQNFQILMAMLNEYYARIMQASAMILNPAFPPEQKAVVLEVMRSAHDLIRRVVERFDIENIDTVIPNLMGALKVARGVSDALGPQPGGVPGDIQPPQGAPVPGPAGPVPADVAPPVPGGIAG